MQDLRKINCDFLTIGQYLAPSAKHHPVVEYIHPISLKHTRKRLTSWVFICCFGAFGEKFVYG